MKKSLLALAAFAAITSAYAQNTYNYFDPADCDADGWLWFDTQEKLDKYCVRYNTILAEDSKGEWVPNPTKPSIALLSTTYEVEDGFGGGERLFPELDPTLKCFNTAGEFGGEGSWTGGIYLYGTSSSLGSDDPNGSGFALYLPSCASIELALSLTYEGSESEPAEGEEEIDPKDEVEPIMQTGLWAGAGWMPEGDMASVSIYWTLGAWIVNHLCDEYQYTWKNIVSLQNGSTGNKIVSAPGKKASIKIRNNRKVPLIINGMKVLCYTSDGSGVADVEIADQNAPVEYYNLQGIRVANPENGLFIRRQGSKTEKVIL